MMLKEYNHIDSSETYAHGMSKDLVSGKKWLNVK